MTTQVFIFRLLFGLGSFVIGINLLRIAYNRGKVVDARGEGTNIFQRWQSGSKRMLNGQQQKWDIGSKACLGLCFLYTAFITGFNLITDRTAGEYLSLIIVFTVLFALTVFVEFVAALKSEKATERTLAMPDPLEMDKQIKNLARIIKNDAEAVEKLQPVLELMGRIRDAMDNK